MILVFSGNPRDISQKPFIKTSSDYLDLAEDGYIVISYDYEGHFGSSLIKFIYKSGDQRLQLILYVVHINGCT